MSLIVYKYYTWLDNDMKYVFLSTAGSYMKNNVRFFTEIPNECYVNTEFSVKVRPHQNRMAKSFDFFPI